MSYDELVKRLREQDRLGLFFLPDDHVVVSYGESASAIEDLHSSLSTARAEGRREGLEEAAKVAERVAESYDDGSDQRADDLMWGCARDIRAKIEETRTLEADG